MIKSYIKQLLSVSKSPIRVIDMMWCSLRYGTSPNNYKNFDFANTKAAYRKSFFTYRDSKRMMSNYNNSASIWKLENKYQFSLLFSEFYNRKCLLSKEMTIDEFRAFVRSGGVIYKPLFGGQGNGIRKYALNADNYLDVFYVIKALNDGVVEELIVQHEEISAYYRDAVNPIRMQTVYNGNEVDCISATITFSNGTEIANASATRAIFCLVDVETGIINTDGIDYDGNYYLEHPITGLSFKGFKIPLWKEVLYTVKQAAKTIPDIGYIGWDIAISNEGVVIIEGNNDPGYTAYQLPSLTKTHKGIRDKFKKYL